MTTISEYKENFPEKINEILKKNMLEKLDPDLKAKLMASKGDITYDAKDNTFVVSTTDEDLRQAITADLKSKR
jgi:hypothetical protein